MQPCDHAALCVRVASFLWKSPVVELICSTASFGWVIQRGIEAGSSKVTRGGFLKFVCCHGMEVMMEEF